MLAVETNDLVKTFGATRAVDGIDLAVPAGTVYGVLGPNGAGKTTIIRVLATLLRPTAGSARVLGRDVVTDAAEVRALVSLTGQFASVDEELTGAENLVLLARLLGFNRAEAAQRADELLDAFGLTEAAGRLVSTYSGGMRRRLDIAASIVVTPELLFLDEPTTVLLTTQHLDEADQLANRIAIIDHGKLIAEGTSSELKASVGRGTLRVRLADPDARPLAKRVLAAALGVPVYLESDPAALSARSTMPDRVAEALAELLKAGISPPEFTLGQPSLDEVFLALTGHPAEDQTATDDKENAA